MSIINYFSKPEFTRHQIIPRVKREEKNLTKGLINNQNNENPDIIPNRINEINIQGPNCSNVLEIYS